MNKDIRKLIVSTAALVLAGILSMTLVAGKLSSPEAHRKTIEALDQKKTTVLELTAASTAASTAITLMPGDAATPIANKLADFSTYFLAILCAIFLEKYLVTITGYVAFKYLIPIACVVLIAGLWSRQEVLKRIACKVIVFGFVIAAVIPASVKLSNMIEETYQESINETLESAKDSTDVIEESQSDDEKSFLENLLNKVENGVDGVVHKFENILNRFIEAIAVLLVTSCLIPIAVILFCIWLIKLIFGISIPIKPLKGFHRKPESAEI